MSQGLKAWDKNLNSSSLFQGASQVVLVVNNLAANTKDEMQIRSLGRGRSPGEGNGNHSSILAWRNSMDRGAWWATVHVVTKSQTQLSN